MNCVKVTSELNGVENEKSVNIEKLCYARFNTRKKKYFSQAATRQNSKTRERAIGKITASSYRNNI